VAATTDCNALYCALEPREGARIAVAEAARNLTCAGAQPLAVTDNLNFGNPHHPENFWQLRECVEGLAEACRTFNTPVTGGNVSLYNESPAGAIDPTPTVGMVGLVADEAHVTTSHFKSAGDAILLIGELGAELGASHYLKVVHGRRAGRVPHLDFQRELAVQEMVRALIRSRLLKSAHDCSEGGLAVALAESCLSGPAQLGATVELGDTGIRIDQALFNESQSRIVVTALGNNAAALLALCAWRGVPARRIGTVGGTALKIAANGQEIIWEIQELSEQWHGSIARAMEA
jgi:phosphoribosylformylglycinamidine synthase subunit PurL